TIEMTAVLICAAKVSRSPMSRPTSSRSPPGRFCSMARTSGRSAAPGESGGARNSVHPEGATPETGHCTRLPARMTEAESASRELAGSTEAISDAANGVDQRIGLLAVQLAAHPSDIDVDNVG